MKVGSRDLNLKLDLSLLTYNSEKWIPSFFRSLEKQGYPLKNIRVLVTDHSSTDQSYQLLLREKEHFIAKGVEFCLDVKENVGFGAGHNRHILDRNSDALFVLIVNVDTIFMQDTIVELLRDANSSNELTASWESRQKPYEHPKDYDPVTLSTPWSSSACQLVRRKTFIDSGGYDQNIFMYGEDVELSYRLRSKGYVLKYVPSSVIWHETYQVEREIKPLQVLGSYFCQLYVRFIYGSLWSILCSCTVAVSQILRKESFYRQRIKLLSMLFKLVPLLPNILSKRVRAKKKFKFRILDFSLRRGGDFYRLDPAQSKSFPLVSVIVRTEGKRPNDLKACVQSILNQTYPMIELLIVEDGSQLMGKMLDDLNVSRLSNFIYIPIQKVGRSGAGNKGMEMAKGKYYNFLDEDDVFYADHIETLVQAAEAHDDKLAFYASSFEELKRNQLEKREDYQDPYGACIYEQEYLRELLWHHNFLPIQSVLFHRKLYEDCGGFDESLHALEDWNLWVRYSIKCDFLWIPKITSRYRISKKVSERSCRQEALNQSYQVLIEKHRKLEVKTNPSDFIQSANRVGCSIHLFAFPKDAIQLWLQKKKWGMLFYYQIRRAFYLFKFLGRIMKLTKFLR